MRAMKDSGVEWIGDIPQEWKVIRLKTVGNICSGNSIKNNNSVYDGIYEIYGGNGFIGKCNQWNISGEKLIIGRVGALCGNIHYSNTKRFISDNALILSLTNNQFIKFYYYLLIAADLSKLNTSNAQPLITGTKIMNIKIPLVYIEEQQRIASYLDARCAKIDTLISQEQTVIEKLKEYKQSMITQAVTKGLNQDVPMKYSGVDWIGDIPAEWNIVRGKNALVLIERTPASYTEGVVTCFRDGEVTLRNNRRKEGFTFSDKEIGYKGIEIGDLVIHGMDGFAGAIGVSDSRGKGSPVLIICNAKYGNHERYFMYYLRVLAFLNVFLALAKGIRERSCDLRWHTISNLPFIIPSISIQQRIVDYLDARCAQIETTISKKQMLIDKLTEYKKSLIYEVVTGKKEV